MIEGVDGNSIKELRSMCEAHSLSRHTEGKVEEDYWKGLYKLSNCILGDCEGFLEEVSKK